jgi:hypothetical protein
MRVGLFFGSCFVFRRGFRVGRGIGGWKKGLNFPILSNTLVLLHRLFNVSFTQSSRYPRSFPSANLTYPMVVFLKRRKAVPIVEVLLVLWVVGCGLWVHPIEIPPTDPADVQGGQGVEGCGASADEER